VTVAGDGEPAQVSWSNPFPAQWRLASQGEDQNFAIMATMDTPIREKSISLEEAKGVTTTPSHSIIYGYGRSQNTPLDKVVPMDILEDALGIEGTSALLDIEGIRTYRHAEEWIPYKDPRAALKILTWILNRNCSGAQEKIDDVCNDIVLSLQGLDSRAKEYESFVIELEQMCREGSAAGSAKAFLESVEQKIARLHKQLGEKAVTPVSEVAESAKVFRSSTRRLKLSDPFSLLVLAALSEHLEVLTAYRDLAKRVRDEAGLTVARSPESRDLCERMRELAGQVLRKRYYLEANWLGEEPLGAPEVSYEKIQNL